jgi:hypothetical protein
MACAKGKGPHTRADQHVSCEKRKSFFSTLQGKLSQPRLLRTYRASLLPHAMLHRAGPKDPLLVSDVGPLRWSEEPLFPTLHLHHSSLRLFR